MNLIVGGLIIIAGPLLFIGGSMKSDFFIYRYMVARSKVLWGDRVYLFHQISGLIVMLFGSLVLLGYI